MPWNKKTSGVSINIENILNISNYLQNVEIFNKDFEEVLEDCDEGDFIFIDSPWNMANKEQAEDQAYRIGTKENVTIYTLVCENTIDQKIEQIINSKEMLSSALVDGNKQDLRKLVKNLLA